MVSLSFVDVPSIYFVQMKQIIMTTRITLSYKYKRRLKMVLMNIISLLLKNSADKVINYMVVPFLFFSFFISVIIATSFSPITNTLVPFENVSYFNICHVAARTRALLSDNSHIFFNIDKTSSL